MVSIELPWVEKYRPHSLSDVVGHTSITSRLKYYVSSNNLPNLLFSGPAGVGKTSSAVALAREFFGASFSQNFLELNASDDRGIDVVRNTIKDFARTLAFDSGFKIIFLDESDALTADAQQALRRTMEKYTRTCRFILSCNYSSRIIEPIQSRCVVYRFHPLTSEDIIPALKNIAGKENFSLDSSALNALVYVSQGDMRKAINVLQSAYSLDQSVSEDSIYSVASRARPEEVEELIATALKGDLLQCRVLLDKLMYDYGMSGEDIIVQLFRSLISFDESSISNSKKINLIDLIGDYNFRITEGANDRIQLEALLAQFAK